MYILFYAPNKLNIFLTWYLVLLSEIPTPLSTRYTGITFLVIEEKYCKVLARISFGNSRKGEHSENILQSNAHINNRIGFS